MTHTQNDMNNQAIIPVFISETACKNFVMTRLRLNSEIIGNFRKKSDHLVKRQKRTRADEFRR